MYDIVSIGAATCDIFIKSEDFVVDGKIIKIPYSQKTEISQSLITSGGGATNSSVSFSRLGLKSACLSEIGDDPLSLVIHNDLSINHVDSSLLHKNTNQKTDFSVIIVAPDGGRTVFTNRGDSNLVSSQIDWEKLKNTSWVYLTSLEGNLDLLETIIGFCQEHLIKVSLNPGNRELSSPARLIPLLKYADFLLLNRQESEMLTGLEVNDHTFWDKVSSFGSRVTAITNGREGAHILNNDGQQYYSPIINTHPVDETGAGDSFGSAFVAGLINHLDPPQCLAWAIKNSASVVSALGAKPGLLTLAQIK